MMKEKLRTSTAQLICSFRRLHTVVRKTIKLKLLCPSGGKKAPMLSGYDVFLEMNLKLLCEQMCDATVETQKLMQKITRWLPNWNKTLSLRCLIKIKSWSKKYIGHIERQTKGKIWKIWVHRCPFPSILDSFFFLIWFIAKCSHLQMFTFEKTGNSFHHNVRNKKKTIEKRKQHSVKRDMVASLDIDWVIQQHKCSLV